MPKHFNDIRGLQELAKNESDKDEQLPGDWDDYFDYPSGPKEFPFFGLIQLATNMADSQERLYGKAEARRMARKFYTGYNDPVTTK